MIINLDSVEDIALPTADICIVGAGIVGLSLANKLRMLGARVIVLERGGRTPSQNQVGEGLHETGTAYSGGIKGRAFGLGGTSGLWGGQLIGTATEDRFARPWMNTESWAVAEDEINDAYREACAWLKAPADLVIPKSANRSSFGMLGAHFLVRKTFALPFRGRNFAERIRHKIDYDPDLMIFLNAQVSGIAQLSSNESGVHALNVRSQSKKSFSLHAKFFIVCAGAIESTRLLQLLAEGVTQRHPSLNNLGKKFRDHISIPIGKFSIRDRALFYSIISPRFDNSGFIHPRFELSANAQKTFVLPSAFLHVVAISNGRSVLDSIRRILGQVQMNHVVTRQLLGDVFLMIFRIPELFKIIYWRILKKTLYYPSEYEFVLQIDLEQMPQKDCQISLSKTQDCNEIPKIKINWEVGSIDICRANEIAKLFADAWTASPFNEAATIDIQSISPSLSTHGSKSAFDVYHPIGSTAFGKDPTKYAVDENLRVRGFDNLYTVSTAVLPSSGCANPTFSAIALAFRLAKHITSAIRK
jgi:choline dehydrogenase-like flavoprotein